MQTPLGEHPSSGKFQKINGVQILEIGNEKITNIRNYFDLLSMLMQFGAIG
jgi:limonene-1,2-epoxide hydrolase